MQRIFWITLISAALASLGCVVPSLHPLFTEEDLVFDPHLIGAWVDEDDDFWVFEKSSKGGYLLTVADRYELSSFDAHLLELGSHRFLDLYPRTSSVANSFHSSHLLRVHTFYKVDLENESLQLIPMSGDWLEEMIQEEAIHVAHAWPEGDLLLTAQTAELQELVLVFADDPTAFPTDATASAVIVLEQTIL